MHPFTFAHSINISMNRLRKSIFVAIILLGSIKIFTASAQQTEIYHDAEWNYKLGYDLYLKEKYSAAIDVFNKALLENLSEASRQNAVYYKATSAAELFHPDAEILLLNFIEKYPQSTKAPLAHFQLGKIYFKQKKYKNAADHFEKTDVDYLKNDEVVEYYFKTGYSYFAKKDYDNAGKNFSQITNVDSKYKTAAQYYSAHVAYEKSNNKAALEQFFKLQDSETFGPLVPFYIVQIYFDQKKYDELLDYALPVLQNEKTQNKNEIRRLVAEAYYRKGLYAKAISYFEDYNKNIPQTSREDKYQLGFCNYMLKKYETAAEYFKQVVTVKDKLAQNAYYHLADCFIKSDNKQAARAAFESASKMDFDTALKEEALFNYAKLACELNFQPSSIKSLTDFIKNYPQSKHKNEASELLAGMFMQTHNYKEALATLDAIKDKNASVKTAYQKVAFFRAVELYNDRDYKGSIALLNKSITNNSDPLIQAQAIYWKSEALYNQAKYDEAIKEYRIFIFSPKAVNLSFYNNAHYDLGYCYFKKANYKEAASWFRKYIANKNETDANRYNDALVRIGDAFFVQRDFASAENYYAQAVSSKAASSDYSLFQRGIIQGIRGNMNGKSQTMQQLLDAYRTSNYADDAMFEKANALMAMGSEADAGVNYHKVITNYPASPYVKKSMLNQGLIYFNAKQDAQAISTFKNVITKYPATPEATEALNQLKNIYVSQGNPNGYFEYVKNIPFASVTSGAQDSITYEAAEQRYMKGDYKNASKDFSDYQTRFPNGAFVLNATFYKAECDFAAKDFVSALRGYESVVTEEKNLFTERSLLRASGIYFSKKEFDKALISFAKLETAADYPDNKLTAQIGLMRCNYQTGKCPDASAYAQKVIANDKSDQVIISEAHLVIGRCAMVAEDLTTAQKEFSAIAKGGNSEIVAEAKYNLALVQYKLGNFKDSQKKCFEVIKQVPAYEFWIGKSFILLADNYMALKDTFQAKQTLQSIIDNYEKNATDTEDLRTIAREKLDLIVMAEPKLEEPVKKAEDAEEKNEN